MPILLFGGIDPSGGAGLSADMRTLERFDCHSFPVPTCLTVQNSKGVERVVPVDGKLIEEMAESAINEGKIDGVKIGLCGDGNVVHSIEKIIKKYGLENVVLDTVFSAQAGGDLISEKTFSELKKRLVPLADILTPNLQELRRLTGIGIHDEKDAVRACEKALKLGCKAVAAKHLEKGRNVIDFYVDPERKEIYLKRKHLKGGTRGGGCVFSTLLCYYLSRDSGAYESFIKAEKIMEYAKTRKIGNGIVVV